jgi:hypothetical protein
MNCTIHSFDATLNIEHIHTFSELPNLFVKSHQIPSGLYYLKALFYVFEYSLKSKVTATILLWCYKIVPQQVESIANPKAQIQRNLLYFYLVY